MYDYFIENGCSHTHKSELPRNAGIGSGAALVLLIIVIAVIAVLVYIIRVSFVIIYGHAASVVYVCGRRIKLNKSQLPQTILYSSLPGAHSTRQFLVSMIRWTLKRSIHSFYWVQ